MRPHDRFIQEDTLGKVYDLKILSRVLSYARPYWKLLALAILISAILSGSQVVLPYLTKIGIDRYILVNGKCIDLNKVTEEKRNFITAHYNNVLLLKDNRLILKEGIIDPRDRNEIYQSGAMADDNYYILDLSLYHVHEKVILEKMIENNEINAIQSVDEKRFGIPFSDLKKLSKDKRDLIRKPDKKRLLIICSYYLAILLLSFFLMYSQVYLMAWIGQHLMYDIRTSLFHHIQRLPISFFHSNPVGRLVTRVTNDVNVLNEVFTSILVDIFKNSLLLMGIVIAMLFLSHRLAVVTLCILPVMIVITIYFKRKMRGAYRKVREKIALINSTLSEHLSGIKIIQAFAKETYFYQKFTKVNHECFNANMNQLVIQSIFSPVIVLIENIGIALILFYGGGQVLKSSLTLGTLVAFLGYLSMFFRPVRDIAEKFNIMQSAMAASERILQILNKKAEQNNKHNVIRSKKIKGEIEFQNVWFAYENDNFVIKDVSFHVAPGETVAFVGATGSGKTTLINLLTRFYSIQKGKILLDGFDIEKYDKAFLRKQIAVVLQDIFLFHGSIIKNIRLNNESISVDRIMEVSKLIFADKFISRFPKKYNQVLKEGGATISQGQKQLLAFARALVFDPKILILDEATANIDSETEGWIQAATQNILKSRTALIIAHRLSTIQKADKIIVMHKGRIAEEGTHSELYAKKGLYHKLYQIQFREQNNIQMKRKGN